MASFCPTAPLVNFQGTAVQHRRGEGAACRGPGLPRCCPTQEVHNPPPPRRLSIRTHAAAAATLPPSPPAPLSPLATYSFSPRRAGTSAEWFQQAVREVVKQVDTQAPFLQTVQLGRGGAPPRLATYGVNESVVAAPELWQGVAEHLGAAAADVVILVQRVSPHAADSPQGAMDAAEQGAAPASPFASGSAPSSPRTPRSPRVLPEETCRRLVSSGLADDVLQGQVGDCCDGHEHEHEHAHSDGAAEPRQQQGATPPARPLRLPAIVPFSPSSGGAPARRAAVRTAALRPPGAPAAGAAATAAACQQSACYWGVVVQSRRHTGVEGCYLLKTVKNVSPGTGCSCTHFSLTRISAGQNLEQQFVQSWLL